MSLNIKALALTGAVLWGACFLLVGVLNLIWPPYGEAWLNLGASIYPGYHGADGFGAVIVVTLYALVDGAVAGAILAWLYNVFAGGAGRSVAGEAPQA